MAQDTTKKSNNETELFDFIYIDKYRLYSLVSQLDQRGILAQQVSNRGLVTKESATKSGTSKGNAEVTALIAKGSVASERNHIDTNISETLNTIQDHFNTEHLAPIFLIKQLINNKFAVKKLEADYGQLIHLTGKISIKDTSILKNFYPLLPYASKEFKKEENFIRSMLDAIPHQIIFSILTNKKNQLAWSTLQEENFPVSHLDFLSKHGNIIAGEWECLAILDSKLSDLSVSTNPSLQPENLEEIFELVLPALQPFFGRPKNSFGISPIAIFRRLKPESQE